MNKTLTAAVVAAVLPFSFSAFAANDGAVSTDRQFHTTAVTTPQTVADTIVPVDLSAASQEYDVKLPAQPLHMQADTMIMRSSDGYVKGRGNVDIQQGMDEIYSHVVEGNTNTQVYYAAGPSIYFSGENALTAKGITYNGQNQGMSMLSADGFLGPNYYVRGTDVEMVNGVGYMKHALITTPHAVAKTPDYYITGDDVRIYPGEKFTVENAKLWFKHICILTYGHYEGRLDDDSSKSILFSLFPRPFFNSDDGFGLRGRASFPMNDNGDTKLNVRYAVTSKDGFKPAVQVEKNTSFGTFRLGYSQEESTDNDNNIWATKWPELEYFMPRLTLGNTGVYVDGSANWGRWSEDGVATGTHLGYRLEMSHTPLPLWQKASLRFFTGYRRDLYSTNNAQRRDPYWGVILNQGINDRLWATLWYKKHNIDGYSPYRFDTPDNPRQQGVSFGYVLTPLDTVIFTLAQDIDTHRISDRNLTWIRDMHSFIGAFTYKQIDKTWEFKLTAKDLDF